MDITKKHNTEIYKDAWPTSPKNITQKYIKMRNMDLTNKYNTEIYKDEQHGRHHQKHSTEIYKDEQHGHHQKT